MIRKTLLGLAAIAAVAGGLVIALVVWSNQNEARGQNEARSEEETRSEQEARAAALGVPLTEFNLKTAHGLERGCNACHADLAADVGRLVVPRDRPQLHGIFVTSYGIPMRVEDCLICHGRERAEISFGIDIHSLHFFSKGFASMDGNCDSCHALMNGKFVLYDDQTRYNVLNGVNATPTPPFAGPAADDRGQSTKTPPAR